MQELINNYNEAMKAPRLAGQALVQAFAGATLEEKMVVIVRDKLERERYTACIWNTLLGSDSCYTGPLSGNVSLYDDLYWCRNETKTLSEVLDMSIDKCREESELQGGETAEQLAAVLLVSEQPRCEVLRDFLQNNLGSAEQDW